MIEAVSEAGFTFQEADVQYGSEKPSPKGLLKFLKSTGLKDFTLSSDSPNYPTEFFDEAVVQQMKNLNLGNYNGYSSQITEQQLLKMKATSLVLGRAKQLTANSVRSFFQPVFDGKTKEMSISFKRFFQLDFCKLFSGFDSKEWKKQDDDRVWELQGKGKKYEFRLTEGSGSEMAVFSVKTK